MTDRELLQMALDVMLAAIKAGDWKVDGACDPDYVLEAIRARLSQCERCGEVNPAEIHTCTPQGKEHMTTHMTKVWFDGEKIVEKEIPEEKIYDPSWCIEYCKKYAEQLRDKTRANRAEHAAECIEYLLSLVQKEWQGLTDDERTFIAWESNNGPECVAMTEAKLKEKNA